jgi:hypothetical protein
MLSCKALEFPGQPDEHFFTVLRYDERAAFNPRLNRRPGDANNPRPEQFAV